jgi:hypothetical protein
LIRPLVGSRLRCREEQRVFAVVVRIPTGVRGIRSEDVGDVRCLFIAGNCGLGAIGQATDDTLHWIVWTIPGSARARDEGMPQGNASRGPRQISATGPYYRGVTATPGGVAHHYVFEIYALDANIDVPAVGQSPALTRAAIETAMAGKIRARGTLVGLFKR